MHRRVGRVLFWWVIGLVAGAFMLAVAGEETASTAAKQRLLNWHEWIGLSSLVVLILSFAVHYLDLHPRKRLMPRWLPGLRVTLELLLYVLLVLQPISGWLLASHEGNLATFFSWVLPPLADPSDVLGNLGYIYHGVGGVLIFLVAILSLRLNLTAWVFSLLGASKGGPNVPRQSRRSKRHGR